MSIGHAPDAPGRFALPVAALGFGASAWKTAPRDRFIGWSHEQRIAKLSLVVNNARFLIFPWVHSPNLTSRVLSTAARMLPRDREDRYGYRPVLLDHTQSPELNSALQQDSPDGVEANMNCYFLR